MNKETNSNVLITLSFQPKVIDHKCFKLGILWNQIGYV